MKNKNQNKNNGLLKKAVFTVLSAGLSLIVSCSNAPVVEKQEKPNVERQNIQEKMEYFYNKSNTSANVAELRSNFEIYNQFEECLVDDPKFSDLEKDVSEDIMSLDVLDDAKNAMTLYQRIQDFKQFYSDLLELKKEDNDDAKNIANIDNLIKKYGDKTFKTIFVENEAGFKFVSSELKNYFELEKQNLLTKENKKAVKKIYQELGNEIASVIESKIYDSTLELAKDYNNKDKIVDFIKFLDDLSKLTTSNEVTGSSYIKTGEAVYEKIKDYVIYTEEEKIGALTKKDTKTLDYYMNALRETNDFENYKILMDELINKGSLVNKAVEDYNNKVDKEQKIKDEAKNNLTAYLIKKFIEGTEPSGNYKDLQKELENLRNRLNAYENKKEVDQTNESN